MQFSLRHKIILICTLVFFSGITAYAVVSSIVFSREYLKSVKSETLIIGQTLKTKLDRLLRLKIEVQDLMGFEKECRDLVSKHDHVAYAMVTDPAGKVLFHSTPALHGQLLTETEVLTAIKKQDQAILKTVRKYTPFYDVIIPVLGPHKEYVAAIRIGLPADVVTSKTTRILRSSLLTAGLFLILGILVLIAALRTWVSNPIKQFINVIELIRQQGSVSDELVDVPRHDELGQLAAAFNHMVLELRDSQEVIRQNTDELEQKVRDRTAKLEQAHKKLEQAKKMEVIGTLAGGVAHDLNNILSGLVSYPELILLDLPEQSPLVKSVQTIQQSGLKAAAIVQDLLALARRGAMSMEVLNLNEVLEDYFSSPEFQQIRSFHPQVEFQLHLDPDLLNTKGSAVHLSKAVMNLVSNAAEATARGGRIRVSSQNCDLDNPIEGFMHILPGTYAMVRVSDTGSGISHQDLEKIFEPFYTKKVMGRSGTGLGMTVVWGTVSDHNGYIDVRSTKGQGTTFDLYFPVTHDCPSEGQAGAGEKQYRGNGQAILVVDDIAEQREIACAILTRLGYAVTAVASGEAAIEYLRRHDAALVLLDMIMQPGIDGLQTYQQIILANPTQKAIIASGYSETEKVKAAMKLGVGAFLSKPYLLKNIAQVVYKELRR